jgi:hypothetical protein
MLDHEFLRHSLPELHNFITSNSDYSTELNIAYIASRLVELANKYSNSHRSKIMPFLFGGRLSH